MIKNPTQQTQPVLDDGHIRAVSLSGGLALWTTTESCT